MHKVAFPKLTFQIFDMEYGIDIIGDTPKPVFVFNMIPNASTIRPMQYTIPL